MAFAWFPATVISQDWRCASVKKGSLLLDLVSRKPLMLFAMRVTNSYSLNCFDHYPQQALEEASDDTGWANLGTFGSYLTKLQPDFDARLYGFKKLSELVKAKTDLFQIENRKINDSDTKVLYVRAK